MGWMQLGGVLKRLGVKYLPCSSWNPNNRHVASQEQEQEQDQQTALALVVQRFDPSAPCRAVWFSLGFGVNGLVWCA